MKKEAIYNLNRNDWKKWADSNGVSSFYHEKIWESLYRGRAKCFADMEGVRADHLANLEKAFFFPALSVKEVQRSSDRTLKFLFQLEDKSLIETVLMHHSFGNSVCVTTQIGCNIGCAFCASGQKPKKRDLSCSEIIAQILGVDAYLKEHAILSEEESRITHLVVMGIGEPFDNFENLIQFLSIVTDGRGLAFGSRHITVSTSGIAPKIIDFAERGFRSNLAISLHAPNDALRSALMKINRVYPIARIFEAITEYIAKTNKRVTFEYILIKGFNDSLNEAEELATLLEPIQDYAYVNLIPYNPVFEAGYERSEEKDIAAFFDYLSRKRIRCVIRKEHGSDIDAACGQLRSKYLD